MGVEGFPISRLTAKGRHNEIQTRSRHMQHSVFDCLPVFVVMDNAGLKSLRAAWLESLEKVWTPKIWLRLCFAWKMIEQNIIA